MPYTFRLNPFAVALAVLVVLAAPLAARAGAIRHDRDDAQYRDLAAGYPSVGRLNTGSALCSGTLIGVNWVLTAAHCVDDREPSQVNFVVGGQSYKADTIVVEPTWTGEGGETAGNDLALVRLDDPVVNIVPAAIYDGADVLGRTGTAVGFGRGGTGLTGSTWSAGTKRAGQNVIDRSGRQVSFSWSRRLMVCDFDNPDDPGDSRFGSNQPIDLEYCIAGGDSGGGLFADIGGVDKLVGVHSFISWTDGDGDSDYGDLFAAVRLSYFTDWIESQLTAAGNDTHWQAAQGDWSDPAFWSAGVPGSESIALVENGRMATIASAAEADHVVLGRDGGGSLLQSGGSLTVHDTLHLGGATGGKGMYVVQGGSLTAATLRIGHEGEGVFYIGDASAEVTVTERLRIGDTGTVMAAAGSTIRLNSAEWVNESETPGNLSDLRVMTVTAEGGAAARSFEVAGEDVGPVGEGLEDNFALGVLNVGGGSSGWLRLDDFNDNRPGADGDEALYVEELVLGPDSVLDLNGLNLYALRIDDRGGFLLENGGTLGRIYILGDFDANGVVNGLDIPGFKEALADPAGWQAATGRDPVALGDFDGNGALNGLDIPLFKDSLAATAVPEPGALVLVAVGLWAVGRIRR